ncbi:hypothetical protein MXL46_07835 [Heyndrickxia sporothermodurans]|uniref:hypothetical protein n=1 Tax=Heyndrickxia sporothermodurans TaxID=46224 RepID=UPI002DB7FDC9|nr:hypothetical protein [Heyndrickxia sporothermodurans]MEB6549005.1 hypothetical protein [Heyndrickxia sporothermodurans]
MATRILQQWYWRRGKRYDGNANLAAMVPEKGEAVRWQRESRSHGTGKERSGTMATQISYPWYRKREKRYDGNTNLVAMVPEKREAVRW